MKNKCVSAPRRAVAKVSCQAGDALHPKEDSVLVSQASHRFCVPENELDGVCASESPAMESKQRVATLGSISESAVERHPLEPFLPADARLLMLGSFPPQRKRWSMDFYYPNLQNDMWRIFGYLFFEDRNHFLTPDRKAFDREHIVDFLTRKGIALFDTASAVRRLKDNASDQFLEVVEATDLGALLRRIPRCVAVVTTGGKAAETAARRFGCEVPAVGTVTTFAAEERVMRLWRMPSSSRAYPMALERKAAAYRVMFEAEKMFL